MSSSTPNVAVLYNAPILPPDHPDAASEADVVNVAESITSILNERGLTAFPFALGERVSADRRTVTSLARLLYEEWNADARSVAVFNLIEGFGGSSLAATHVTGLLEMSGIPYTGCPAKALAYCQEKSRTKALLRGFGLPTAPWAVIAPGAQFPGWDSAGPVMIKPDAEDGSLGIDQGSVVSDRSSAQQRIKCIHETYGCAAVVEAYLPGPEYNIGVLGLPEPAALPIAEVLFAGGAGSWPILTYDAKWSKGSAEDRASPIRCPADIEPDLAAKLRGLALAAFQATGCRDYARIDVRLDNQGEPMILEVNPNPDLGPTAGWARALETSGLDYASTIAALARQALARGRRSAST